MQVNITANELISLKAKVSLIGEEVLICAQRINKMECDEKSSLIPFIEAMMTFANSMAILLLIDDPATIFKLTEQNDGISTIDALISKMSHVKATIDNLEQVVESEKRTTCG